jgi:predicted anti-sigma-YlaC factor YlaD
LDAEDNSICLRLEMGCIIVAYYAGEGISVGDILLIKVDVQDFRITLVAEAYSDPV